MVLVRFYTDWSTTATGFRLSYSEQAGKSLPAIYSQWSTITAYGSLTL
jgi:hypothetical protein